MDPTHQNDRYNFKYDLKSNLVNEHTQILKEIARNDGIRYQNALDKEINSWPEMIYYSYGLKNILRLGD